MYQKKRKRTHRSISVFVQEINYMSENIWDKAAEKNEVVDFHDIMYKFTLDSFIL